MAPQRRRSRSATDDEASANGRRTAVRRRPEQDQAQDQEQAQDQDQDQEQEQDQAQDQEQDQAQDQAQDEAEPRTGGAIRTAREAARAALSEVLELTAKQPESLVGVQRTPDGWSVCFELVEDRRIPSSTDILASYEANIDANGELVSFRRTRRYSRGAGDNGGSTK